MRAAGWPRRPLCLAPAQTGEVSGDRVGELVIGPAGGILESAAVAVDLAPIRQDPNAAGLIGAAHLLPS